MLASWCSLWSMPRSILSVQQLTALCLVRDPVEQLPDTRLTHGQAHYFIVFPSSFEIESVFGTGNLPLLHAVCSTTIFTFRKQTQRLWQPANFASSAPPITIVSASRIAAGRRSNCQSRSARRRPRRPATTAGTGQSRRIGELLRHRYTVSERHNGPRRRGSPVGGTSLSRRRDGARIEGWKKQDGAGTPDRQAR